MPKKALFTVPKWDDDLPDHSKDFKVKKVPFLVDKVQESKELAKRKILKANRLLKNGATASQAGKFVRALPTDDDIDDIDDTFDVFGLSDRGRKRQLSDDSDSDNNTFEARLKKPIPQPRKVVIAKSAFDKAREQEMEEDPEDANWQTVEKPKKKMKKSNDMEVDAPKTVVQMPEKPANNGNDFRNQLIDSLKGSRFRYMNEQMYKCKGEDSKKMFDEDPKAFVAYHEGYRQQVEQWPTNPLDRIIKSIKKLPINNIIADFGCGEARLAAEVPQETHSLDLVAAKPEVIACDMAHTPLSSESIDVAVFCLSLMGTNLKDFLLEANRVLKPRGTLKIAEVASRFDNVKYFVANVEKCGFSLQNQDTNDKLFYYFNFKKQADAKQVAGKVKAFSLKPCLYKKR